MEMRPQLPPHQGNRIRKHGARFVLPCGAAPTGRSLVDQLLGDPRDNRLEAHQRWCGAGNGALT
jgi:hypothetical protein